jgi:hypothetical protein
VTFISVLLWIIGGNREKMSGTVHGRVNCSVPNPMGIVDGRVTVAFVRTKHAGWSCMATDHIYIYR